MFFSSRGGGGTVQTEMGRRVVGVLTFIARNNYSPETVLHGVTGYRAASDESVFTHLEELLYNPGLRQDFGRNGRRLSEKYDWDVITAQWEQTFHELVKQRELRKVS